MLKDEQIQLLNILKESLRGKAYELPHMDNDSFVRLMKLSEMHQVLPLVCESIYQSACLNESSIFHAYKQHAIVSAAMQKVKIDEFLEMQKLMQEADLDPIVVKGTVCQFLYPKAYLRTSIDDDLFVPDEQFNACHRFLLDYGLVPDYPVSDLDAADEISYHKDNSTLYIELHRSLFSVDSDAYGSLNRFFDKAQEHTVQIQAEDADIRTLSPTDHFLYLILHTFKHFLHSGIGIRPVCDIGMFADHYYEEIDWAYIKECLATASAYDYTRALLHIIDRYLLPDTAYLSSINDWNITAVEEEPMLEDILESGVHGASSMSRLHSSNITLSAAADSSKNGILQSIFLPLKNMEGQYPYLKKAPFLLPYAWVQRIVTYVKETRTSQSSSMVESMEIGRERVKLLKKYGIIQEKNK